VREEQILVYHGKGENIIFVGRGKKKYGLWLTNIQIPVPHSGQQRIISFRIHGDMQHFIPHIQQIRTVSVCMFDNGAQINPVGYNRIIFFNKF
jgi:hypothetical protein